jgi:hypothetical protein
MVNEWILQLDSPNVVATKIALIDGARIADSSMPNVEIYSNAKHNSTSKK